MLLTAFDVGSTLKTPSEDVNHILSPAGMKEYIWLHVSENGTLILDNSDMS